MYPFLLARLRRQCFGVQVKFPGSGHKANLIKACGQRLAFSVRYFASLRVRTRVQTVARVVSAPLSPRRRHPVHQALANGQERHPRAAHGPRRARAGAPLALPTPAALWAESEQVARGSATSPPARQLRRPRPARGPLRPPWARLAHASRPASRAGEGRRRAGGAAGGRGVPRTAPRKPWWAAEGRGRGGVGARRPAADTLFHLGPCVACASCSAPGAGRCARTSLSHWAAGAGRRRRGCAQEQLRNAPWAPALSARRAGGG